jgi:hypothetical protein
VVGEPHETIEHTAAVTAHGVTFRRATIETGGGKVDNGAGHRSVSLSSV